MPYIIDGNNLIGSSPDISLDDKDSREKIIYVLKKYQEVKNNNIIVVFDGEPDITLNRESLKNKFTIRYPKYGNSADDEIKKIMNKYSNFKDVILVSSDRELKSFAKKKGARTINSIEFYFELKRVYHINGKKEKLKKRINIEISEKEVDSWMKIFAKE